MSWLKVNCNNYILFCDKLFIKRSDLIKLSSKTVEYQISVLGDVTGTGTVTAGDIAKMYQSVKGKITLDNVALLAGDVTQDGKVAVNDVAKAYAYLKGKLTSLE